MFNRRALPAIPAFVLVVASLLAWASPARAQGGAGVGLGDPMQDEFRHDPGADVAAISAELGLADFSCAMPRDRRASAITLEVLGEGDAVTLAVPMTKAAGDDTPTRFSARVMLGKCEQVRYRFSATFRAALGAIGSGQSKEFTARLSPAAPRAPHASHALTPDWAKGAVWYQVFPERFRNGNPANDPKGFAVFLAPWNSNWYDVQPGELEAWKQRHAVSDDKFRPHRAGPLYNVIYDRRYGGDLQGVLQKLDELKDLGVTALYFNPIFQAQSLHKYDASDFRHIDAWLASPAPTSAPTPPCDGTYTPPAGETADPKTWTWTPADRWFVDEFLPACKERGMRVILDGVWNHTGVEFWAFQDIRKNGKSSPYADWYICEFGDDGKLASWTGWPGRKDGSLPEFRQVKGGYDRDRDTTVEKGDLNSGVREHVFAVTRRWMDPNGDGDPRDGIDGWRLDVAGEVGEQFWKDWRALVKSINPEAITVAEIWSKASDLFKAGAFDTQMHYPFAYPVLDWLRDSDPTGAPVTSQQLAAALQDAFDDAPQVNLIHQNLFASHDTDRLVNMLWNKGRGYDRDCAVQNGDDKPREQDAKYVPYKPGKPPEDVYRLSVLGVAIQATYLGSPMIYNGDEYGMWGADDPTCRKPTPWPDAGSPANPDDAPVPWVRDEYRNWLRLRQDEKMGPVLRYGAVRHVESNNPDVFLFERQLNQRRVLVVINRGSTPVPIAAAMPGGEEKTFVPARSAATLVLE